MRSWQNIVIALVIVGALLYSGMRVYESWEVEQETVVDVPTLIDPEPFVVLGPFHVQDKTPTSVALVMRSMGSAYGFMMDDENLDRMRSGTSYEYMSPDVFTHRSNGLLITGYEEYELEKGEYYLVIKSFSIETVTVGATVDVGMDGFTIIFQDWMMYVAGAVAMAIGFIIAIGAIIYGGRAPPPQGKQGIGGGLPYSQKGLKGGGLFGGNRRM